MKGIILKWLEIEGERHRPNPAKMIGVLVNVQVCVWGLDLALPKEPKGWSRTIELQGARTPIGCTPGVWIYTWDWMYIGPYKKDIE